MSDQEIWNQYYMTKPTDTGNMKPDDMDDYTPAWAMIFTGWVLGTALGTVLVFAVIVLALLVKGCA